MVLNQTFPSPCKIMSSIFASSAAAGIVNAACDSLLSLKLWYLYFCSIPPFLRYFLLCVNYFFYGETVTDYFFTLVQREEPLRILSKYHRFISFALYLTGTNTDAWFENETYTDLSLCGGFIFIYTFSFLRYVTIIMPVGHTKTFIQVTFCCHMVLLIE